MFNDKLELLMHLTATRNNALSRALHLDEATISRLRSGKRNLPRDPAFLMAMCSFFVGKIKEDYQRQTIADLISPGEPWSLNEVMDAKSLYAWLSNDQLRLEKSNAGRSGAFESTQAARKGHLNGASAAGIQRCYYGVEGKKAAVIDFFEILKAADKPRTVLLYSDEAMGLLMGDAEYTRIWEKNLWDAIEKGNRFRIIHTISRPVDELAQSINLWMPLYVTGKMMPFFYPHLHEGITRRTLFIAPPLAAISGTSVGERVDSSLTQLVTDPEMVKTMAQEFENYLQLCMPLTRNFKGSSNNDLQKLWMAMDGAEGACVCAHKALSLATMPASVAQSIARKYNNAQLPKVVDKCLTNFQKNLLHHSVAEILILPHMDTSEGMQGRIALSGFPGIPPSYYTREEFASHLERVVQLMNQYENYYVTVGQTPSILEAFNFYYKERFGVLITLSKDPDSAFYFEESTVSAAFGEYLSRWIPYQSAFPKESRETTIAILLKITKDMRKEE
jgi:hypothetical protein